MQSKKKSAHASIKSAFAAGFVSSKFDSRREMYKRATEVRVWAWKGVLLYTQLRRKIAIVWVRLFVNALLHFCVSICYGWCVSVQWCIYCVYAYRVVLCQHCRDMCLCVSVIFPLHHVFSHSFRNSGDFLALFNLSVCRHFSRASWRATYNSSTRLYVYRSQRTCVCMLNAFVFCLTPCQSFCSAIAVAVAATKNSDE